MKIYIGADHRGFELKEKLKQKLAGEGIAVEDLGAADYDKEDDYVDFAVAVAKKVSEESEARGIVICGSGVGVNIAANKVSGARCGFALSEKQVHDARQHDDINVLALPSDFVTNDQAGQLVKTFLATPFEGAERQKRRLEKLHSLEHYD